MEGAMVPFLQDAALVQETALVLRGRLPVRDVVDATSDDETGSEHSAQDLDVNAPLVKSLMGLMPREHVDSLRVVTANANACKRDGVWCAADGAHSPEQQPAFIGSTASLKDLFSLPYTTEAVTVGLHRMGDSLLLDGNLEDALESVRQGSSSDTPPLPGERKQRRPSVEDAAAAAASTSTSSSTSTAKPAADALSVVPPNAWTAASFQQPPEPQSSEGGHSSLFRQFYWNLHELKLMLGSDQMVAGTAEHPRVAVKVGCNLQLYTNADALLLVLLVVLR
jgi:hypothetical protein